MIAVFSKYLLFIWIQSSGVDSPGVHYIASDIIKDLKTDENPERYVHLPHTAFLFTSILLIAIGKTYNKQGMYECTFPPCFIFYILHTLCIHPYSDDGFLPSFLSVVSATVNVNVSSICNANNFPSNVQELKKIQKYNSALES